MKVLLSRLVGAVPGLDATAIAEAIWLAAHRRTGAAASAAAPDPPRVSGGAMMPRTRVWITQGIPLPQLLESAHALRAFKRPWSCGRHRELDITATVSWYGRTRQLLPIYRPAPERWIEMVVVVDQSPSMALWDEVVAGFIEVLRQIGAFRSVRRYGLSFSREGVQVRDRGGRVRHPGQLCSPEGRSLILLVSDGVDPGWRRAPVWRLLRGWAGAALTSVVNPLPTRLWRRTGFDFPAVRVTLPRPGASNRYLRHQLPFYLADDPDANGWVPIPAATLAPRSIGRWARTLVRAHPSGCDALLMTSPGDSSGGQAAEPVRPAVSPVEPFLRFASPAARRLAVLSSVYSPLSLPLLHLIRRELVPEATIADLAELQVGRLVVTSRDAAGEVTLRFHDEVRAGLRRMLREDDLWRLHRVLSA